MQKFLFTFYLSLLLAISPDDVFCNCIYGNCIDGKGTYLYADGSKYFGNFGQKKPNGKGILRHKDGSVYEGEFKNGNKSGYGKLSFTAGDIYAGYFENGVFSGKGDITYRNGDTYSGEWLNGQASGTGNYSFKDGDIYEGEFMDGQFSGYGKLSRKNGSYYQGTWSRSKKHGKGVASSNGRKVIHFYEMNQLIKELPYSASEDVNLNTVVSKINNSQQKEDCTQRYCHLEKGFYTYGDGSVFFGPFVDGQGDGIGECLYSNGDKYIGEWKNHAPQGKGTIHFKSGNTYTAIWENGRPKQRLSSSLNSSPEIKKIPTQNQNVAGNTRIFALIVGVATYNHMSSLKYTDDDAYQLYAFLKSPEGGAIPDSQIKIMIDDGATNQTIRKELKYITEMANVNDVILLYMSGHGIDGAYIPSDFDGYKNQLPYDDILSVLNKSKAKHKLFIADACHSGSMLASARTPLNISLENFYSAYNTAAAGSAILMSSKKDEVSLEYGGLRQGVFSHFLIKGLKGEADENRDKLVTITELHKYISANVKQYTGNTQNPSITGDFDKNMPVAMVR